MREISLLGLRINLLVSDRTRVMNKLYSQIYEYDIIYIYGNRFGLNDSKFFYVQKVQSNIIVLSFIFMDSMIRHLYICPMFVCLNCITCILSLLSFYDKGFIARRCSCNILLESNRIIYIIKHQKITVRK